MLGMTKFFKLQISILFPWIRTPFWPFRFARHHGLNGSLRLMGYSIWRKTRWDGPVKMGRIPTYLIWLETMLNGKRYLWLTLNIRKVILAQLLLFLAFKFVLMLRPRFLHANFNRDIIENTQSVQLCLFSLIMNSSLLAVTTVVQISFFFSMLFDTGDFVGKVLAWCSLLPIFILVGFITLIIFRRELHTVR